jgi:carbamoylphosphate synthase small subunit
MPTAGAGGSGGSPPGKWSGGSSPLTGTEAAGRAARRFDTEFGPAEITHVNLNDGVVEGLRLVDAPAFAVQYHPEAAPGPHDANGLFSEFCQLMERGRARA